MDATEIVVTVDTSFGVPCTINRVLIEVTTGGGETQTESVVVSDADLPGSVTLVTEGNPGQLTVKVTGLLDDTVIATAQELVEFSDEASKEVRFLLDQECSGAICGAESVGDFNGLPAKASRVACGEENYTSSDSSLALINNACSGGTIGNLFDSGDDELELESPLDPKIPFPFFFYGKPVETFFVGDNGYLTFASTAPSATTANVGDPRSLGEVGGFPAAGILPFWERMIAGANGVCLRVDGSAPSRTLVVTWDRACFSGGTCGDAAQGTLTFSVGLEETTNKIFIVYHAMTATGSNADRAEGQEAVIGISGGKAPACSATECADNGGMCLGGGACGFTEFSSLETVISGNPLPKLEFTPVAP